MHMNPVVHFEFPFVDKKRMVDFYTKTFGWQAEMLGADMGEYVLVTTAERDAKGFPKEPGRINGGFFQKKTKGEISQHPSVVIAVDDIKEAMKKVEQAGGKILGETMDIPGFGTYANFLDTEGNQASMMQPTMGM